MQWTFSGHVLECSWTCLDKFLDISYILFRKCPFTVLFCMRTGSRRKSFKSTNTNIETFDMPYISTCVEQVSNRSSFKPIMAQTKLFSNLINIIMAQWLCFLSSKLLPICFRPSCRLLFIVLDTDFNRCSFARSHLVMGCSYGFSWFTYMSLGWLYQILDTSRTILNTIRTNQKQYRW